MEEKNGKIGNAVTRLPNFGVNFGAEKNHPINFVMKLIFLLRILNL